MKTGTIKTDVYFINNDAPLDSCISKEEFEAAVGMYATKGEQVTMEDDDCWETEDGRSIPELHVKEDEPDDTTVREYLAAHDVKLPTLNDYRRQQQTRKPKDDWSQIRAGSNVGQDIVKLWIEVAPVLEACCDTRVELTRLLVKQCDIWYFG